jgi:membrane-associated protease RseP (regulator of RpoE activity)
MCSKRLNSQTQYARNTHCSCLPEAISMSRPLPVSYLLLFTLVMFGLLVSCPALAVQQTSPGRPPPGERLTELGTQDSSYLGVQLQSMTEELREAFDVPSGQGVLVLKVAEDSPAARAGLQVGDVITRMGDKTVRDAADVQHGLEFYEPGETVAFEIIRDRTAQTMNIALAEESPAAPLRLPDPKVWREPLEDLMQELLHQWDELLRELEKASPPQEPEGYL